jgi:hypothetical protein
VIKEHLESFNFPAPAVSFLVGFWDAIQLFDDVADQDKEITREELDKVLWFTLVDMHCNEFFIQKSSVLLPHVSNQILKWQASNTVEKEGKADQKSFGWRAGYYDLVLAVAALCFDRETVQKNAHNILSIYGETYAEYIEEFE